MPGKCEGRGRLSGRRMVLAVFKAQWRVLRTEVAGFGFARHVLRLDP
jgi:hypothetical protein